MSMDHHRVSDLVKGVFAYGTIVADSLDVQKTSVGLEADLPQGGKVVQPLANAEVAGVVDGGLGTEGPTFLVILLDAGPLVISLFGQEFAT